MPITQILLTATAAGGGGGGGGGTTPDGDFSLDNVMSAWGSVGVQPDNKPTYNASFSFPNGVSTGPVWDFNGTNQFMTSQLINGFTQMYMNIWFYPTAAGCILMTVQQQQEENVNYHYAALIINANSTVSGRFWANGYFTTANTVTLNQWNHIYFRHTGSQALIQLNGGTAVTQNGVWSYPTPLCIAFGTTSATNNGVSARFQGTLADVRLNSSNTASIYDDTKSQYEAPQPFIYDDFTIEWWQRAESNGQNSRPWGIGLLGDANGTSIALSYEGAGRDYFWINGSFPAQLADRPLKNHYGIGWEHMAIVRKDNVINLYSNGTNYLSWSGGNQAITASNRALVVGSGELAAGNYQGNITDLHIIKGYAKYNANFTPPTSPIQPQTGSVFLLPATASGGAYDDVISYKSAILSNTPTWSVDNPYQFPTQTFAALAYDTYRIAFTASLPYKDAVIGLKVSDTQGWSDYVTNIPVADHVDFDNPVPVRAPGEVYTIEEAAISAFSNSGGFNGGVGNIDFTGDNYWKALEIVKPGWSVSTGGPSLGLVTSVNPDIAPGAIRVNVNFNPGAIYGTYTFTPPASSGSIRFDTGDRISYGASVDWAFDVDAIETGSLNMDIDANNFESYNSSSGSVWYDLTANAANIALSGSPYWDNGPPGSMDFNGSSQYGVGSATSIVPSAAYTKMVWFRLNSISADNNIVSSSAGGHFMYFNNSNRMWAGHANVPPFSGAGAFGSTSTFSIDTWYCVAVTFSVADGIKLYINGVLDASDLAYTTAHTGDGSTNIGCFAPGGNLLNGKVGRVMCYGTDLTASQVLQNFEATRNRYGV